MPHFTTEGRRIVLEPLLMQAVPRTVPSPVIPSVTNGDSAVAITTAINEVIPGGYG